MVKMADIETERKTRTHPMWVHQWGSLPIPIVVAVLYPSTETIGPLTFGLAFEKRMVMTRMGGITMRLVMMLANSCGPVMAIGPIWIFCAGSSSEASLKNMQFVIMARKRVAMHAPRRCARVKSGFLARYPTDSHM